MHLPPVIDLPRAEPSAPRARLVVASIPSGHVYVRHLAPENGGGPVRLPDPDPAWPARSGVDRWWPPAMLEPAWVEANVEALGVDLAHLHFGFDDHDPARLDAWISALRRRGTPYVLTVHDLRNPHHHDRRAHDAALDVLVPAADQLVTLTPGAAAEIESRWGRTAAVVPHPHVVDLRTIAVAEASSSRRRPGPGDPFRVGLHVKSLRANADPMALLPTLVETVAGLPGAELVVNGHHDVLDPTAPRHDHRLAAYLTGAAERGLLELAVHDYLPDAALWQYLHGLDVSVLPYRFGTHSGWLEACRDLGTTVVAPTCGYLTEQGPVLAYAHDEDGFDADSLATAVRVAHAQRPRWGATLDERRHQRAAVAAAHDAVYAAALEQAGQGTRCASA